MARRRRIHQKPKPPRYMSQETQVVLGVLMCSLILFFVWLGMHG